MEYKLSDTDIDALYGLREMGRLIENIPDKQYTDYMGNITPGLRTYKKLEKLGLVLFEEDDEESEFRAYVNLTNKGYVFLKQLGPHNSNG